MSTLPFLPRPVQTRAEFRLAEHVRHLTDMLERGAKDQNELWQRVREIGVSLGLSPEDAEQYADRWLLDGPVF